MRTEHQFWDFARDEDTGERILYLEGPIDNENWWGDEVTPKTFKDELEAGDGDIVVYITSPGGNVFAASDIYTMLLEYKGKVTVKISSLAASAASVIAMAGDVVKMSPTAQLMIHNPMTIAMGNVKDFEEAIIVLNKVRDSIVNAYHLKSGLSKGRIASLLDGPNGDGTWLPADEALKYGFIDEIIVRSPSKPGDSAVNPDEDDPEEADPKEDEPEEEGGEDPDTEDPDTAEPGEDDPDEDDPEKRKTQRGNHTAAMYSRMTDYIHREYLAMVEAEKDKPKEEPEEPKEEPKEGPEEESKDSVASEIYATYDVMLKQLEMCMKM